VPTRTRLEQILVFSLLVTLVFGLFGTPVFGQNSGDEWIHTYLNTQPFGNWTYVSKPMYPVGINYSQIRVGANWTYVYPLEANHTYHVYCYGDWIDTSSNPKTDYDIYVYDPRGKLEGYHTEAAGLPEHLGTTVDQPFFKPSKSGNYSFVIRNDPRESQDAKNATLMVIEHIECNAWYEKFIEGKVDGSPVKETSWAFEFNTNSQRIEVVVQVPDTLDMYEARLYLMANPSSEKGEMLNGVPLAWEPALYGERTQDGFGGYNLDSKSYRGVAYASCEYPDMLINYTCPLGGESLYHLVLIGEVGSGTVKFMVKTRFEGASLELANPIGRVYPNNETKLTFVYNASNLKSATLYYSTDDWQNETPVKMEIYENRTCNATIPAQQAGTTVEYRVEGLDALENLVVAYGNFTVKHPARISCNVSRESITIGENITVFGTLEPAGKNASVSLTFTSSNGTTIKKRCYTQTNGSFTLNFKPPSTGKWFVQAKFEGDETRFDCVSEVKLFRVQEPPLTSQYSTYIYAGAGAAAMAVVGIVVIRKRRG